MWNNVYCFTGNAYLVREKAAVWKKTFIERHASELNVVDIVYDQEEDINHMVEEMESMPFLAPFKLIFIHKLLDRKAGRQESDTPEEEGNTADVFQRIANCCERAPETSIIVFLAPAGDKRRSLYKKIVQKNIKDMQVTENLQITGYEEKNRKTSLVDFFLAPANNVSRDVLEYLIYALIPEGGSAADLDLFLLANELEKLEQYASGRAATTDDVDQLIHKAFGGRIFDFTDALSYGQVQKAVGIMQELLYQGEDIFALWGNVMSHFRKLMMVRVMLEEKQPSNTIRASLGKAAFLLDKVITQAKRFSFLELQHIYRMLLEIDVKLKTGGIYTTTTDTVAFQLALERFIVRAASAGN